LANHKSAQKRIRQSEKRRMHNKTIRTAMRTVVKNCRTAERSLQRAASKGIIPKARADRAVSRLARRLNRVGS
jgi:small subunit ribosomal protein S20